MAVVTAFEIETLTVQYTAALEMLLQQNDSRLRGSVDQAGGYVGKAASPVQYMSTLFFETPGQRGSTLQPQSHQYQRRWVSPQDKDLTIHQDTFDKLRTIVDPTSTISQSIVSAANRWFDDLIITAFFGTAQYGAEATTSSETYDSGSNFPVSVSVAKDFKVGASVGLTPKKLIEARRILAKYENDLDAEMPNIAVTSQQEDDLMSKMEVISTEYRERPVLENGKIGSFLGFNFHRSERLGYTEASVRAVPVWLKGGIHLGTWKEMSTTISQRTDLVGHPWQAYSMVSAGATRLQGGKVVRIACADTSGGPINP